MINTIFFALLSKLSLLMPSVIDDEFPQGSLLRAETVRSTIPERHDGSKMHWLLLTTPISIESLLEVATE